MPYNKIVYGSDATVILDLTSDTVTSSTLLKDVTAHDKSGDIITGTIEFSKIYIGSADPTDDVGDNGDLYLKVS